MTRAPYAALIGCLIPAAWAQSPSPKIEPLKFKVKYICGPGRYWTSQNRGERHYCFDGVHYSKSTGGVPAFVLEYWEQADRKGREFAERMKISAEEAKALHAANEATADRYRLAHGLPSVREQERISMEKHRRLVESDRARAGLPPSPGGPARGASSKPAVEGSAKPPAQPVRRDLLTGIAPGAERTAVIEALGPPHGTMSNLGADGDEESLTYLLEGGGQAGIRLKNGKVSSVRLP